jgi:undecaprenyl pyrophosphate synthase
VHHSTEKDALHDTQRDAHSENVCQLQQKRNSQNTKNIKIKSVTAARPAPKNNNEQTQQNCVVTNHQTSIELCSYAGANGRKEIA